MAKDWAKFYSKTYDPEFLIQNAHVHLDMFKSIINEQPKRLLEVGTGTSSMSIFLSYLDFKVSSLDNNLQILEKAKVTSQKLNGKVDFIRGDAFKLPFQDQSFDLVFHQGFLEHFTDEEIVRLLDEQLRISKVVVFSVPNNYYQRRDFGDERLLSKKYWDGLLNKHYDLKESKNYNPIWKTLLKGHLIYRVVHNMYMAKIARK